HKLAPTSAIALGRLLTATALVELSSKRNGSTSFQIITQARMHNVYADLTHDGNGRGFVRGRDLAFPALGAEKDGRRSVAAALFPGKLHVVRALENGRYTHSTTELATGEVDTDVEHFLQQSDQVSTALACDVLVDGSGTVDRAGGVMIQCLPGGDEARLRALREVVHERSWARRIAEHDADPSGLLHELVPEAVLVGSPRSIQWKCRCSRQRAIASLQMLSPQELAEMTSNEAPTVVDCDLCGTSYSVEPAEVLAVFTTLIKAQG
ncbi:Hsp33 family molecular chaperone HslO, partial [Myxococcota bacterium]|nr:Hsp33 family molecular chaperone HslO [Myxococcota bacterium]